MEQIPSFSAICELLEGNPGAWEKIRPVVKLALSAAPGLSLGGLALMEVLQEGADLADVLEQGMTLTDVLEKVEESIFDVKTVFGRRELNFRQDYEKCRLANTLLVFAAYFDTLRQSNPLLWQHINLQSDEVQWLTDQALKDHGDSRELFGSDGQGFLPRRGEQNASLQRFYGLLNDRTHCFADGLEGGATLRGDWNHYPTMAAKVYRMELVALCQKSHAFLVWVGARTMEGIRDWLETLSDGQNELKQLILTLMEKFDSKNTAPEVLYLPPRTSMGNGRFQGRKKELARLKAALGEGNPIVLTGLGGIGKTELAAYFAWQYRKDGRGEVFWATFNGSFRDTIIRSMGAELLKEHDEDTVYRLVLEQLRSCKPWDLLIIDNVEPDGNRLVNPKDEAYRELCGLSLNLILTTRFAGPGFIKIQQLDNESLYQIFQIHEIKLSMEEMDALIRAVDGHTMTVDLIARTIAESSGDVTVGMILEAMSGGAMDEELYPDVDTDHDPEQRCIDDHLLALFKLSGLSDDAKTALRYGTLLPPDGLDNQLFRHSMEAGPRSTVRNLERRGWLRMEGVVYTIHPVIRLVCRRVLVPTNENCEDFLLALWDWYKQNQYDKVKYRQLAELFSCAWYVLGVGCVGWADRAGILWGDLGDHRNALAYQQKVLELREKALSPDHSDLAASYNSVGCTYCNLGDHKKALAHMHKALEIQEKILPVDHLDLAVSYGNIGVAYRALGDHEKALEFNQKALKLRENGLPLDHPDLAESYNNVGNTYSNLRDHGNALTYQQKALEIREKVLPADHPALAESYNNVGNTYGAMGDYGNALAYHQKAMELWEKVLPANHPNLAILYNNVGANYSAMGDNRNALVYMLKSLEIREKILPVNHPDLAISHYNVGRICITLDDNLRALGHIRLAALIGEKALPADHPHLQSYRRVLAILEAFI